MSKDLKKSDVEITYKAGGITVASCHYEGREKTIEFTGQVYPDYARYFLINACYQGTV